MSKIGLTIPFRLKTVKVLKKGVKRSWVRILRKKREKVHFPIAMKLKIKVYPTAKIQFSL